MTDKKNGGFTDSFVQSMGREPGAHIEKADKRQVSEMKPRESGLELTVNERVAVMQFAYALYKFAIAIAQSCEPNEKSEKQLARLAIFANQLQLASTTGLTHPYLLEFSADIGAMLWEYHNKDAALEVFDAFAAVKPFIGFDISEWMHWVKKDQREKKDD